MSQLNGLSAKATVVPNVTETDLSSFHEAHFGKAAIAKFSEDFLDFHTTQRNDDEQHEGYGEEQYYDEEDYEEAEEDDGLGYYADGAKRTLTDEQIAMFRHSEMHALQRAREKAQDKNLRTSHSPSPVPMDFIKAEEGELTDDAPRPMPVAKSQKKTKKKKRGSGNGNKRWEPDPERRKRTWDVVETGLDGLDYGETEQSASPATPVPQRRRITYDEV